MTTRDRSRYVRVTAGIFEGIAMESQGAALIW